MSVLKALIDSLAARHQELQAQIDRRVHGLERAMEADDMLTQHVLEELRQRSERVEQHVAALGGLYATRETIHNLTNHLSALDLQVAVMATRDQLDNAIRETSARVEKLERSSASADQVARYRRWSIGLAISTLLGIASLVLTIILRNL